MLDWNLKIDFKNMIGRDLGGMNASFRSSSLDMSALTHPTPEQITLIHERLSSADSDHF